MSRTTAVYRVSVASRLLSDVGRYGSAQSPRHCLSHPFNRFTRRPVYKSVYKEPGGVPAWKIGDAATEVVQVGGRPAHNATAPVSDR